MSSYLLKPKIDITETLSKVKIVEKDAMATVISQNIKNNLVVFETYPGVDLDKLKKLIESLKPKKIYWSEDYALQGNEFRNAILPELTEDRVFGKFTRKEYIDYFKEEKLKKVRAEIKNKKANELVIVYGIGASYLVEEKATFIYVDLTRWEAQLRYRAKKRVFFGNTLEDETIKNFKRGYFVEWRLADKIKIKNFNKFDLVIDSTQEEWKMTTASDYKLMIKEASLRPFRLVPYFDAGVWGGKWMEEKFDLGKNEFNRWAWGFDGVPEENSVIFKSGNSTFEMPAINIVLFEPKNLLGESVMSRFGNEFPIRFDFLDTIKGGNLSLQVHPTTQYIYDQFGARYTQEESYYILDADESAQPATYLGLKDGVKKEEFFKALEKAKKTNKFDAEKYVNKFSVKKHDHLSHPQGVVHSSASGCMVLEISSTPYIFTFKLWDWGRLGLNGLPRPINLKHGKNVIDESFNTQRASKELVSPFELISESDKYKEEKTGLHEKQFIETRRFTIKTPEGVVIKNNNSVNMLNFIEGEKAIVESTDNSFAPLEIHYAETFIVPESCKEYRIRSLDNKEIMILQAYVRTKA